LSFNLATEETAQYFSQIKEQFDAGRNVQFDFSNVEKITIDGLVILLGFIKNYEVNRGHLIDFVEPLREDPRMLLRRFNVFKKVPDKIDGGLKPIPMIKVSNTIVANGVAKDLTRRAALSLYGKGISHKGVLRNSH
jgi:ABC-type transporter Mla MlaB component